MKRSEINAVIKRFEKLLEEHRFELPPFCKWTPEEWQTKGHEYDEIRDNMLGWDVTDYGMGDFGHLGLALITIRNGNVHNPKYTKTYAEKIINRGGNDIHFTLYNATEDEQLADTPVKIFSDGRCYTVPAGETVVLKPGQSLSLYPYYYHEFVIPEGGPVLIGEVSMCNDDNTDNRFLNPLGRFPTIEEDEPPYRLLCNEYPKAAD